MANADFLLDAFVATPAETLEWLEQYFHDSCDVVVTEASSVISALKLTHNLGVRQCRASVDATAKSIAAVREGLRGASAALNATAALCASAMAFHDLNTVKAALEEGRRGRQLVLNFQAATDAFYHNLAMLRLDVDVDVDGGGAGGLEEDATGILFEDVVVRERYFKQWVDISTSDGCGFVCKIDNRLACFPRGRHSFTLHANIMSRSEPGCELVDSGPGPLTALPLVPADVIIDIHGDASATYTCTRHPDGCGVVVAYTVAYGPDDVEIVVRVLGAAVFTQCLVITILRVRAYVRVCIAFAAPHVHGCVLFPSCRYPASVQQLAFAHACLRSRSIFNFLVNAAWHCVATGWH